MSRESGKHVAKHTKTNPQKRKIKKSKKPNAFATLFEKIKKGFLAMPKKKKNLVITLSAVILVLAILIGIVLGVFLDIMKDYNHQELDDPEINQIQPIDDKIMNIALFGIDTRSDSGQSAFKGLSDSIMILSINTGTGDIKLISVMRDSFVEVPGYKRPQKINSAYSLGGPSLAIKTLNQNFGLDIKEYATVNFFGMAEIIDAVGGIEIDVIERELKNLNQSVDEQCDILGISRKNHHVQKAGKQNLTGIQAVAWARIRKVSTSEGVSDDYGRTDRQRVVMEQLLNKALATDIGKYPTLIKAILPHLETSLSFNEVLSLATHVLGNKVQFEQTRVPQTKYVINGGLYVSYAGSVVYYDLDYAEKIIHAVIYDGMTQEEYMEQNGVEKNSWYSGASNNSNSNNNNNNNSTNNNSTSSTGSSSQNSSSTETESENSGSQDSSSGDSGSSDSDSGDSGSADSGSEDGGSSDSDTSSDQTNTEDTNTDVSTSEDSSAAA